jgi:hypothetical protein
MSHCFLIGSPKDAQKRHKLRILHYIEYLTYDLEKKEIHILADFFVKNLTEDDVPLYGLHTGNIEFESKTEEWFEDDVWTPVLLELARDEIGLIRDGTNLLLCDSGNYSMRVELLRGTIDSYGPERDDEYGCSSFSGWRTPNIAPKSVRLFRISGNAHGKTYEELMLTEMKDETMCIMGGKPLEEYMKKTLVDEYREEYLHFERSYLQDAEYYHVFFERTGKRLLKVMRLSPDMRQVCKNRKIGRGRFVNWCWSNSDFNIHTRANGPLVELVTK